MKKTDIKHLVQMYADNISPLHIHSVINRGHIVEPGSLAFECAYDNKMFVTDESELCATNCWLVVLKSGDDKKAEAPEKAPSVAVQAKEEDAQADEHVEDEVAEDAPEKPKRGRKPKSDSDGDS